MKPPSGTARSTALTTVPLSSTRMRAGVTWTAYRFHWSTGFTAAASAVASAAWVKAPSAEVTVAVSEAPIITR